MKYEFEIVDNAGTWSATRDIFKYMCKNKFTNHKESDWEEAEKHDVYDPRRGTTCPEKDALAEEVDKWIKSLNNKGLMLVSIYPENNLDEDGYYTKEYRNRYLYPIDAKCIDILNKENYIAAFINY